ncbi:MAG: amino acid ABC transporter permease [Jhaorihella sp.]
MGALDFSVVIEALPYLLQGLKFSALLTVIAFVGGLILGTFLALVIHFEIPLGAQLARAYVALIRSVPLIMVLFWFFFLVPVTFGWLVGSSRPLPVGATWTAFITFTMFEAAYYCEIIRVGLRSVPRGQFEAAEALSLSRYHSYAYVVLPQVFRTSAPIILTQTIILFQDTSLVYVLSLTDLVGAASKVAQLNGRLVEMYLSIAIVYFLICFTASQCVSALSHRVRARTTP